jgi:hypothetical protein
VSSRFDTGKRLRLCKALRSKCTTFMMNMASGVNVSPSYSVKQMVRTHESCRLRMTFRPEIWTRQIDDTTAHDFTTGVRSVRQLEEIRKPEGNGWDWVTPVTIV